MQNMRICLLFLLLFVAGCACTQPMRVEEFPSFASMKTPARHLPLYAKAQEDFLLLQKGDPPKNARKLMQVYDGGSVFYKGEGYELISRNQRSEKNGKSVLLAGSEIVFDSPISKIGRILYSGAETKIIIKPADYKKTSHDIKNF